MVNLGVLLTLVIFILILTALAPTIISSTCTYGFNATGSDEGACNLENASAGGKSMYGLMELLYPVIGIIGIVVVMGLKAKLGQ